MTSVRFQGKPFNITIIQVYAPTSNAKEAEVDQLYKNLEDILELTPKKKKKKDVLFINRDWNAKVGSQETHGITGKSGLGEQNEARAKGKLIQPRECTSHSKHPFSTTQETTLHVDTTKRSILKSN